MKNIVITCLCLVLVAVMSESLLACTSFAVYSGQVWYGMNFDFLNIPMKFLISTQGDIRTFHLAFERMIGDTKFFVNTAAMNSKGLFASCQEMHPVKENPPAKTDDTMFTFELYDAVNRCSSVDEIEALCRECPLVDMAGITLHNLFADTSGNAVVTEAGDGETLLSEKDGDFIVMTNFPNSTLWGKDYMKAEGKGADRYILCHDYLQEHSGDFTLKKGLDLLEKAYNRDYDHIWRVSLADGILASYRGFDRALRYEVHEEGVPVSDLLKNIGRS